ncbi:hypothetical protein [Phytohalomonas tamaricis]|uniref:hypothetical protein n=1 Tax=Phytohalomonas tamaricis TaxID=2081032 RepID=UPI00131A33BA|nr:hypothetical protein [Phytohalomonas tamaricis]
MAAPPFALICPLSPSKHSALKSIIYTQLSDQDDPRVVRVSGRSAMTASQQRGVNISGPVHLLYENGQRFDIEPTLAAVGIHSNA